MTQTLQDRLVQCLQLCVSKFSEWQERREEEGEEDEESPEILKKGREMLQSLIKRMIKSEPEDFELVHDNSVFEVVVIIANAHLYK